MPSQAAELINRFGDRVKYNHSLAPLTTFRIGGPADIFLEVRSAKELADAILIARESRLPWFLLGLGANILVGDLGFRGLVIRNAARNIEIEESSHIVTTESGAICFPDLIERCIENGLSGLEHFAGIPSTVGGALWQNLHFLSPAPARERTIFIDEVLLEAELLLESGERVNVPPEYFQFGYDYSILHDRSDVVLRAKFQLKPGQKNEIERVVRENLAWRSERHPPLSSEPSAGSIFKKIEGIGAGRLIDQSGLKGKRLGGAEISQKHANFIVNRGNATALDVLRLVDYIRREVLRKTGYMLETEIRLVGSFGIPDGLGINS